MQEQDTLEYQRMFLAATLENMSAGVVACNEKGELVLFNRVARDWHGLDPLRIPQKQWARQYDLYMQDGMTPMDTDSIPLIRAFHGEKIHDIGMVIAAKGKSKRHILSSASPIRASDGRILGAITVMQDITERKLIEEVLKESENRYRRLMESTIDYIYTVRLEKGHAIETIHGPGCLSVTGYSCEEFKVDPYLWYRMVHLEDRDKVVDTAQRALKGMAHEPLEHRIYHRDGTVRWLRNTIVVKKDDTGKLSAYDGLVVDITDRKKAEEELREAAKEWERTFDSIRDLIFIQDKDMHILKINKACIQALKMDPKDIIGKKCHNIMHHLGHTWPGCPYEKTRLDQQIHTEVVEDSQLGIPLMVTVSPIFDAQGEFLGAVHVAKDISETRKSEIQKREHLRELEIFYKGSVGREERILELKEEIIHLKENLALFQKSV